MRLSNFFRTSGRWTQNAGARNAKGEVINLNAYHSDIGKDRETRVESLSLYGALAYFYSQEREPEKREKELMKLKKAIYQHTGNNYYVAEFNNHPDTTFEDIKRVIQIAEKL